MSGQQRAGKSHFRPKDAGMMISVVKTSCQCDIRIFLNTKTRALQGCDPICERILPVRLKGDERNTTKIHEHALTLKAKSEDGTVLWRTICCH